jgi:hypothetical protein
MGNNNCLFQQFVEWMHDCPQSFIWSPDPHRELSHSFSDHSTIAKSYALGMYHIALSYCTANS